MQQGRGVAVLTLLVAATSMGLLATARAERLPVKQYAIADGLPHDRVNCVAAGRQRQGCHRHRGGLAELGAQRLPGGRARRTP